MINDGQGTVREEASAIGDRIEGNAKDAYGAVTGDTATEREGEAQATYGKARQEQNRMLVNTDCADQKAQICVFCVHLRPKFFHIRQQL